MQNTKKLELIKSVYPAFNDDILEKLLEHTRLLKFPKGTKLFSEGKRN